jgi:hypothetical protein
MSWHNSDKKALPNFMTMEHISLPALASLQWPLVPQLGMAASKVCMLGSNVNGRC